MRGDPSWRSPVPGTTPAKKETDAPAQRQANGLSTVPVRKDRLPPSFQRAPPSGQQEHGRSGAHEPLLGDPGPSSESSRGLWSSSNEASTREARTPRRKKPVKKNLNHGGRTVGAGTDPKKTSLYRP
ncbi:hypothetical protein BD414DRAFT_500533 [Trametes punicea]|nr:hypothetical protein BD414DRAFT_500533 [Trametes punicea]